MSQTVPPLATLTRRASHIGSRQCQGHVHDMFHQETRGSLRGHFHKNKCKKRLPQTMHQTAELHQCLSVLSPEEKNTAARQLLSTNEPSSSVHAGTQCAPPRIVIYSEAYNVIMTTPPTETEIEYMRHHWLQFPAICFYFFVHLNKVMLPRQLYLLDLWFLMKKSFSLSLRVFSFT